LACGGEPSSTSFNASDPDRDTQPADHHHHTQARHRARASATSVSSDNYVFSSSYKSVEWYGELIRQQINASSGALSAQDWSAMTLLDTKVRPTPRRVSFFSTNPMRLPVPVGNLTGAQQAYFKAPNLTYTTPTAGLSAILPNRRKLPERRSAKQFHRSQQRCGGGKSDQLPAR